MDTMSRFVYLYRPASKQSGPEVKHLPSSITALTDLEQLLPGDVVLPRFYPFAHLLQQEVEARGARLINSAQAHDWLGNIEEWYPALSHLTPATWFQLEDVEGNGPYFCKGLDKSLKEDWRQFCFAQDRGDLPRVLANLKQASSEESFCIRQYHQLQAFGITEGYTPLAHEFRCFIYQGQLVSQGFYWRKLVPHFSPTPPPSSFIEQVAAAVGDRASYYTADVALTREGEWILIELNDGTLAGLEGMDAAPHYRRLAQIWSSNPR